MQFFATLLRLRRYVTRLALLAAVVGAAYGFTAFGLLDPWQPTTLGTGRFGSS